MHTQSGRSVTHRIKKLAATVAAVSAIITSPAFAGVRCLHPSSPAGFTLVSMAAGDGGSRSFAIPSTAPPTIRSLPTTTDRSRAGSSATIGSWATMSLVPRSTAPGPLVKGKRRHLRPFLTSSTTNGRLRLHRPCDRERARVGYAIGPMARLCQGRCRLCPHGALVAGGFTPEEVTNYNREPVRCRRRRRPGSGLPAQRLRQGRIQQRYFLPPKRSTG